MARFGVLLFPDPPQLPGKTPMTVNVEESLLGSNITVSLGNRTDRIKFSESGGLTVEQSDL